MKERVRWRPIVNILNVSKEKNEKSPLFVSWAIFSLIFALFQKLHHSWLLLIIMNYSIFCFLVCSSSLFLKRQQNSFSCFLESSTTGIWRNRSLLLTVPICSLIWTSSSLYGWCFGESHENMTQRLRWTEKKKHLQTEKISFDSLFHSVANVSSTFLFQNSHFHHPCQQPHSPSNHQLPLEWILKCKSWNTDL